MEAHSLSEDVDHGSEDEVFAGVSRGAVALVCEQVEGHGSQWEASCSVAAKLGVSGESVRKWVRQTGVDAGTQPGTSSAESAELKRLRRENAELRRANEIFEGGVGFLRVNVMILVSVGVRSFSLPRLLGWWLVLRCGPLDACWVGRWLDRSAPGARLTRASPRPVWMSHSSEEGWR